MLDTTHYYRSVSDADVKGKAAFCRKGSDNRSSKQPHTCAIWCAAMLTPLAYARVLEAKQQPVIAQAKHWTIHAYTS